MSLYSLRYSFLLIDNSTESIKSCLTSAVLTSGLASSSASLSASAVDSGLVNSSLITDCTSIPLVIGRTDT